MTLCPANKGHCSCQPDEEVFCPNSALIAEWQRELAAAQSIIAAQAKRIEHLENVIAVVLASSSEIVGRDMKMESALLIARRALGDKSSADPE